MAKISNLTLEVQYISAAASYSYATLTLSDSLPDASQLEVFLNVQSVIRDSDGAELIVSDIFSAQDQLALRVLDPSLYVVDSTGQQIDTVTIPAGLATPLAGYTYTAGLVIDSSAYLSVRRSTDVSNAVINFQPGSRLTSSQLEAQKEQEINALQELTQSLFTLDAGTRGPTGATGAVGPAGADGVVGGDGLGFTGGSYASGTGVVTFTSDDGLGFQTTDLRGAVGATGPTGPAGGAATITLPTGRVSWNADTQAISGGNGVNLFNSTSFPGLKLTDTQPLTSAFQIGATNTTSGFIAPVTGTYMFAMEVTIGATASSEAKAYGNFMVDGVNVSNSTLYNYFDHTTGVALHPMTDVQTLELTAGDCVSYLLSNASGAGALSFRYGGMTVTQLTFDTVAGETGPAGPAGPIGPAGGAATISLPTGKVNWGVDTVVLSSSTTVNMFSSTAFPGAVIEAGRSLTNDFAFTTSPTTGGFIAPVTGSYLFTMEQNLTCVSAATLARCYGRYVVNDVPITGEAVYNYWVTQGTGENQPMSDTRTFELTAGDVVSYSMEVGSGSNQVNIKYAQLNVTQLAFDTVAGADGAPGADGADGATGATGAAGTNGTNGTNGTDGTGFTGGSYAAGTGVVTFTSDDALGFVTGDLRGAAGTNGTNGTNGTDGTGFTGGSYAAGTGVVTFTSDDALGFVTGDLRGAAGTNGADGADGAAGAGVATGGTAGQVLSKIDGTDYNTQWVAPSGGVTSVDDLSDVDTTTVAPTSGQALVWDGVDTWEPGTVAGTPAELTSDLTISDPVGPDQTVGQVYSSGTTLELIVRDMLVSYQVPDVTNISAPATGSTIEHGSSIVFTQVGFTKSNNSNIDLAILGHAIYIDPWAANVDVSFTHTAATSQTVTGFTVNDVAEIVTASAGTTGTAKSSTSYKVQVTGQDTQGSAFERTESWNVYFRTYFGASATIFNGSNGATVIADLFSSILESDSKRTIAANTTNADGAKKTYFVMPTCHFEAISSIVQNGATQVFGAFTNSGTEVVSGVEYTFFESNIPGAFADGDSLVVS